LNRLEAAARRAGYRRVAGLDEAGRGPLAGPVVAAAVLLPETFASTDIRDSKILTAEMRDRLYEVIYARAVSVGIAVIDAFAIDRLNILQASLTAMAAAASNLKPAADYLLIDGPHPIPRNIPQQPIVNGDASSISIAAASIVAKVTRDRLMAFCHEDDPRFEFRRHKGYATRFHREAIRKYGPMYLHRRTFSGVREVLEIERFVRLGKRSS
jgi:ribonuclease HII